MAKNKKTPKQTMKYWRVGRLKIKARTARKYIRGNLMHDIVAREYELDNPFGGGETPEEALRESHTRKWVKKSAKRQASCGIRVSPWK